jgi:3-(3-hydroxy-phenyl)propionate hydroxylase
MNQPGENIIGIIGAGPVGMTLAARLAGFGVKSLIVDRSPHLMPKGSKACLIQGDALEVLDKIGCADVISEEGIHWRTAHTYIRNKERITQTYPEREGFSEFVNISQYRIEEELEKWLDNNPLTKILWSHNVMSCSQDENQVTLEVDTNSGRKKICFKYIIACDGVGSTLRKLTGVKFQGYTHQTRFLITDIKANLAQTKERHFHFDPDFNRGRQLVMHPQPENIWRIDWQLSADADIEAEKNNGQLDKRIRAVIGDTPYEIQWLSTYRFNQCVVEKFKVGRILFAGDAAHSFPPYGSRGMNSGIADADNLAWKIASLLKGHADESLLDTYHTERYAAAQENLRLTENTIKFMAPSTFPKRLLRNSTLALSVLFKGIRRRVDHGKMTEPFRYVDSPLINSSINNNYIGQFTPDAPIFIDNKRSRLRKLLGQSFVFIYLGTIEGLIEFSKKAQQFNSNIPIRFITCIPKGDDVLNIPSPVEIIYYDDILFFETLKSSDKSLYIIRPDSHIAGWYHLTEKTDFEQIIIESSGGLSTQDNT